MLPPSGRYQDIRHLLQNSKLRSNIMVFKYINCLIKLESARPLPKYMKTFPQTLQNGKTTRFPPKWLPHLVWVISLLCPAASLICLRLPYAKRVSLFCICFHLCIYICVFVFGAVHKLCQPKIGGPDPPSPLCQPLSALAP